MVLSRVIYVLFHYFVPILLIYYHKLQHIHLFYENSFIQSNTVKLWSLFGFRLADATPRKWVNACK